MLYVFDVVSNVQNVTHSSYFLNAYVINRIVSNITSIMNKQ